MALPNHNRARKFNSMLFPGVRRLGNNWQITDEIIITIAVKVAHHKMMPCHLCIVHGFSPKSLTWPTTLLLDLFLITSAFNSWLTYIFRAVSLLKPKVCNCFSLLNKPWVCLPGCSEANLLTLGCGEGKCSVYCRVPSKESRAKHF